MKTWVFGAGDNGMQYFRAITPAENVYAENSSICGFIDSNPRLWGRKMYSRPIISLEELRNRFDDDSSVVISILDIGRVETIKIYQALIKKGVPEDKISFSKCYADYDPRVDSLKKFAEHANSAGIKGNVAECGVFQGHFSANINRYFFDRNLYLFDTFEGFDRKDVEAERSFNDDRFNSSAFNNFDAFKGTSVDVVMEKMPFPELVTIKKGYVPDTLVGLECTFCFVSLDMDLYLPMLEALCFFWDKMEGGGFFYMIIIVMISQE